MKKKKAEVKQAESKPPYMNEFGGALLNPDRYSTVIDQMGRTWSKCEACGRHYLTERWGLECPLDKLMFGAKPKGEK